MRDQYSKQLRSIHDDLIRMGSRVEHAVALSLTALITWDGLLAEQVVSGDSEIDQAQGDLEHVVFNLLATQQPIIATDLRTISATIAIASELERMGDYAKGIARRVQRCLRAPMLMVPPPELYRLATMAQVMVHTSMNAFVTLDPVLARSLSSEDELVDALEETVSKEIIRMAGEDLRLITSAVALLEVTHRLERLADRATNIAERVIFIATNSVESLNN